MEKTTKGDQNGKYPKNNYIYILFWQFVSWGMLNYNYLRLDSRECDALALADVHVWLLLFAYDLVFTLESKVGL